MLRKVSRREDIKTNDGRQIKNLKMIYDNMDDYGYIGAYIIHILYIYKLNILQLDDAQGWSFCMVLLFHQNLCKPPTITTNPSLVE